MKENITRRDWLNKSAAVLGGSILGSMTGINPLKATPTINTNEPVRMMYNENPYGPSQVARRAMRKAFAEANLYSMRGAKGEFKVLMAKQNAGSYCCGIWFGRDFKKSSPYEWDR